MRPGALIAGVGALGLAGAMWFALPSPRGAEDALSFAPEAHAAAPAGCPNLGGFSAFRESLASAIRERDADALVAISHPGIELGHDGRAGIDEMRRQLDDDAAMWSGLDPLTTAPCSLSGREQAVLSAETGDYRLIAERGSTGWRIDSLAPVQPSAASTS